ncbi:MAG: hypothetical protein D6741_02980 [Planctomycetota bacterium]|nr:MAG: hypothetical protein D6741_02980 [Planctomycetota bacterium]
MFPSDQCGTDTGAPRGNGPNDFPSIPIPTQKRDTRSARERSPTDSFAEDLALGIRRHPVLRGDAPLPKNVNGTSRGKSTERQWDAVRVFMVAWLRKQYQFSTRLVATNLNFETKILKMQHRAPMASSRVGAGLVLERDR